jgi:hypothetical protein
MLALSLVAIALDIAPFVGLLPMGVPHLAVAGLVGTAVAVFTQTLLWCWINGRPLPALFVPLGAILALAVTLRSTWLAARRGGLVWRGTHYPAKLLREGTRVKFP